LRRIAMSEMDAWWEERKTGEKVVLVILFALGGIGLLFLFGWIVMLLWNWLMPEIFGLKSVSYWQAWGLLLLSCILFGKIGGSGSSSGSGGKSDRRRKKELRRYLKEEGQKDETAGAEAKAERDGRAADAEKA
jgi:hypothetical protein